MPPSRTGLSTRPRSSPLAGSLYRSQPVHRSVIGILAARHLATGFAQAGNGRSNRMRQPTEPLPDLRHGSAFGSLEQTDQLRALGAGWRLLSTARSRCLQIDLLRSRRGA
jgi:hypothetical protein